MGPGGSTLRLLWLGLSAVTACLLCYAVVRRFSYPYSLEWLEPVTADIAARIRAGLSVYCAPSVAYVSTMKTPLYYYLVAAIWPIAGGGLAAGRLVSILATLGTLGVIWRFVRAEGGGRPWALFGLAFYVATYKLSDRWYDTGRLDALLIFFTMAGLYGLRFWRGGLGPVGAGILLAAAYFTKQTVLMVVVPLWVALAIAAPRRVAVAALTFAVIVVGGMSVMNYLSDGWSNFFLIELPQHGTMQWTGSIPTVMLLLAPALALAGSLIVRWYREQRESALYYGGLLFGVLVCSIAGRLHTESAHSAFMPLFPVLAVLMPLGLQQLEQTRTLLARPWLADALALGQIMVLVGTLLYDPRETVPSRADLAAVENLLNFLRGVDGDVLVMDDRFFPRLAGKSANGLDAAAADLLLDGDSAAAADFKASVVDALRSGRFVGVIDPPDYVRVAIRLKSPVAIVYPPLPAHFDFFRPKPRLYYGIQK